MLQGKRVILGITGSIAAYKAAYLIRALIKKGAEVQVVITEAGKEFITPLTLSTLSRKPVISEFFSRRDGSWHSHVDLGLWADVMIIAPATAATIAKMANGVADNMLITTYLSCKAPVFVAPAMDLDMFAHPATQENLKRLQGFGNHIIEPGTGELASQLEGKGRMEEPDKIVEALERFFTEKHSLAKKKIVITAGPTQELIDPVRFISNHSSGKMGYALAEECARRGAEVVLISGPVSLKPQHPSIQLEKVKTAEQMFEKAMEQFPTAQAAILCAAVADYRPKTCAENKLKRSGDEMQLTLVPNPDIAASLGKIKSLSQCLVGFALESQDELVNAKKKIEKKNLDFIVLNSLNNSETCFGYETNQITILDRDGSAVSFEKKPKTQVAEDIVNYLFKKIK